LATALCLERWEDVTRLAPTADERTRQFALVLSALNGKAEALVRLIAVGGDVNRPSEDLYAHATPLHHAVCSGDLDSVRALVEAGAELAAKDTAFDATPLGWAEHYQEQHAGDERRVQYDQIAAYLRRMATGERAGAMGPSSAAK
jgi:hypothetical protein